MRQAGKGGGGAAVRFRPDTKSGGVCVCRGGGGGGGVVVSYPDPDSQQLRVDYITATWKVGLGN